MTVWCLDIVNGADANAGTSWGTGNAKKYLKNLSSLAAGDTVKLAKTPNSEAHDLTPTFTMARNAQSCTLGSTLSCRYIMENFQTGWTAANSASVGTNGNLGATPYSAAYATIYSGRTTLPASPAANTLYAYKAIGSALNLSGYQEIGCWIGLLDGTQAWNDGCMVLCLCSDTAGATVVDSFPIVFNQGKDTGNPGTGSVNGNFFFAVKGGNLGSSIQSIALYSGNTGNLPPGSQQICLATVMAFVTNPELRPGDILINSDKTFCNRVSHIKDGETSAPIVYFEGEANYRGRVAWPFTNNTMTRYRPYLVRRADKDVYTNRSNFSVPTTGTSGSRITISGGWNPVSGTQDGITFYDLGCPSGYGFLESSNTSTKSYIDFSKIGVTGCYGAGLYGPLHVNTSATNALDFTLTDCIWVAVSRSNATLFSIFFNGGNLTSLTATLTNCILSQTDFGATPSWSHDLVATIVFDTVVFTNNCCHNESHRTGTATFTDCKLTSPTLDFSNYEAMTFTFNNSPILGGTMNCNGIFVFDATSTVQSCPITVGLSDAYVRNSITGLTTTDPLALNTTKLTTTTAVQPPSPGKLFLLEDCDFTWTGVQHTLNGLHLLNCTLTFPNTSGLDHVRISNSFLEGSTITGNTTAATAGYKLIFTGNWIDAYSCTFDKFYLLDFFPSTDNYPCRDAPYRFVNCISTNMANTPGVYLSALAAFSHCLWNKIPAANTFATYTLYTNNGSMNACRIYSYQQTAGDNRLIFEGAQILTETTTVHSAGGRGWKTFLGAYTYLEDEFIFPLARVALIGGKTLTASLWVKPDYAPQVYLALKAKRSQFEMNQPELRVVSSSRGGGFLPWENISFTYTPNIDGVLELYVTVFGNGTNPLYFDDLTLSQA